MTYAAALATMARLGYAAGARGIDPVTLPAYRTAVTVVYAHLVGDKK